MTLVEVLVAVVVLGLGVLAIVALQLVSKRNSVDASAQSLAAQYSWEMIERMRQNSSPASLQDYVVKASNGIGGARQGAEPSPECTPAEECTPSELAAHDVWGFEQQLDGATETIGGASVGGLINPTACITGSAAAASGIYTVTVVWRSNTPIPNPAGYDNTFCGFQRQVSGKFLYGSAGECQAATNNPSATADCFRRAYQHQAFIAP